MRDKETVTRAGLAGSEDMGCGSGGSVIFGGAAAFDND